jgi:hypothetical protein
MEGNKILLYDISDSLGCYQVLTLAESERHFIHCKIRMEGLVEDMAISRIWQLHMPPF